MEVDVVGFFKKILSIEGFIEEAEKRNVVRKLRTIYFYPDSSLKWINQLIDANGKDAEALLALNEIFGKTESDVENAIDFLTSKSVATNLRIPLEIVDSLREATSAKQGIRVYFTSMFFSIVITRDFESIKAAAIEAKEKIEKLNLELIELEALVNDHG